MPKIKLSKKDPNYCHHEVRLGHCAACEREKAAAASISDRILAVLVDNQWHTQREIANAAGLSDGDNYVDIGRDIRVLRGRDAGNHPIVARHAGGNLYEYKLLTPAEADESGYWEERKQRLDMAARDAELRQRLSEAEAMVAASAAEAARLVVENAKLSDTVRFLEEYIKEADGCPAKKG